MRRIALVLGLTFSLAGCSSGGGGGGTPGTGGSGTGGSGTGGSGTGGSGTGGSGATDAGAPRGAAIGTGDGSPGSVQLTTVYEPTTPRQGTDLAVNTARPNEIWAVVRQPYEGLPCTSTEKSGCAALEGRVVIVHEAEGAAPTNEILKDPNAWHFMRRPTSIAFNEGELFATCAEHITANLEDQPVQYIGPTLWTSDRAIFAKTQPPPPDGSWVPNGSHIDMLHETPYCMGTAHQSQNAFFVFNGDLGAIDLYDFKTPHPAGADDHSDGELRRYAPGTLMRSDGIPSHLVYDPASKLLYIADTGNGRVVALDTASGTPGTTLQTNDPMGVQIAIDGANLTEVVKPGVLTKPSGIELAGGVLYVTDHATSRIHAFELDGTPIRSLDTGYPPGSLAGLVISPSGKAFFIDYQTSKIVRIDVP